MVKRTEEKVELRELIRRSEVARMKLGEAGSSLKRSLDVPERLKESIKTKPMRWLGGSMAAGMMGSIFLGGGRKKAEKSLVKKVVGGSLSGTVLRLGFKLAKPTLQVYATKLIKDYLESRFLDRRGATRWDTPSRSMDKR